MSRQTSIERIHDRPVAPGQVDNPNATTSTTFVAGGFARKRVVITVDTSNNNTTYTFTVQGKDNVNQAITITSDADATPEEVRDALFLKSYDYPEVGSRVVFKKDPTDTSKLILAGRSPADDFAISEGDANLSLAISQTANAGQELPFGRGVFQDPTSRKVVRLMEPTQTLLGVTQKSIVENEVNGNTYVKAGKGVHVCIQGIIVVELDTTTPSPATGDQVFCRAESTVNGEQGQFRTDNTDGNPVVVSSARWLSGALKGLGDTRCALLYVGGLG